MAEVLDVSIEQEMQTSYLDYAMSVIIGRALPEVRDGLKPAQRRILYAMYKLNNVHSQPTKKSARIVGETIGKYHPHGDVAVYETLVRMAQDFSMNYMLVEGQGNMGSIDGDPPAAQRYTEVRLSTVAEELLADLEKQTVKFSPNFDNTEQEPVILPAKIPTLMLNGASGIAVGVATSIMPHNLEELCDAISAYIDNPNITSEDLRNYVKAPDFPTGGTVFHNTQLAESYLTGRGTVTIKGTASIEDINGRKAIIITEIPYTVNKSLLVEGIAKLVVDKKLVGVADIRDESGKEGIRVLIELKQNTDPDRTLNFLYAHTQLQISLPIMNIAILGNNLVTLNLKQYIKTFVEHRFEVIRNRSRYELGIAEDKHHILEGLLIALNNIDSVIACIRKSAGSKEAQAELMKLYKISEKQASAILDMKLSKLTSMEVDSLNKDMQELSNEIERLKSVLSDDRNIFKIVKDDTAEMKRKYGRPRRTRIDYDAAIQEFTREDLIADEETTVILTKNNYIKRLPPSSYRAQERGGKGIIAIELNEGDFVKSVAPCMLKDYLLLISNKGRAYWLKAYMVPQEGRYGMGKAIVNLVKIGEGERIHSIINTKSFSGMYLTFITTKGRIKRVAAERFSRPRASGIIAIPLISGDELADVCLSSGAGELFIATKRGKSLRFKESDLRPMGRVAHGVIGMRIAPEDAVVNIIAANKGDLVASITELGYGKVTEIDKYRLQRRAGKGVINMHLKEKTGSVIKVLRVADGDNVLLVGSSGLSIQFDASSVRKTGRSTSGVRVMRLERGVKIVDAQVISRYKGVEVAKQG
jgi:DNA gyrase subunit A